MFKIALIGHGNIAHTYADALANSETVRISAVLGRNKESTQVFADKYGISGYIDAEEMYSKEKPDAVLICTPTFTHKDIVEQAIENGVNIMCEKPFVLDYNAAQSLFDKAEQADVKIMVMQVVRFWPQYAHIKHLMDSGVLGDIKNVYANRLSAHPNWCSWHKQPQKSGGGLYDLHIHDVDYMCWLFGKVKSVYAVGSRTETGCWNNVSSVLNFSCGVSAVVEGFMDITGQWDFCTDIRLNGEKASVEYLNKSVYSAGTKLKAESFMLYPHNCPQQPIDIEKYNPYRQEVEYFAEYAVGKIENTIVPNSDVVYVLKVMKAIEKSLQTGTVQAVE